MINWEKNALMFSSVILLSVLITSSVLSVISFFNIGTIKEEIEAQKNEIEKLIYNIDETKMINDFAFDEVFKDIDCIEQNLNFLFSVGDVCEKSFPEK